MAICDTVFKIDTVEERSNERASIEIPPVK